LYGGRSPIMSSMKLPFLASPIALAFGLALLLAAAVAAQDPPQDGAAPAQNAAPEAAAQEEEPEPAADASEYAASLRRQAFEWLSKTLRFNLGENSTARLLVFFFLILATLVARKLLVNVFAGWLSRLAKRTSWKFDNDLLPALREPVGGMVLIVGFFLAISALKLPGGAELFVLRLFQASTLVVVFWGMLRAVDVLADALHHFALQKESSFLTFIPLIKKAARLFLIIIAVILVIQNLGYSVGSLLAGLGIGGLAVALAAQESLGNFFGSISIVADRPFKIGDWIQVGDRIDGDVEEIGLRSTKMRTWAKSQLSIPNKYLASQVIENWSRMPKRRVKQVVGVTYSTPPETVAQIVEDIRAALRADEDIDQDFILVNFTDFGDSSLEILVYYFTKTIAWLDHMDIRQRMNLEIMRIVERRGSSIAFPTRTLHFDGALASRMAVGIESLGKGPKT